MDFNLNIGLTDNNINESSSNTDDLFSIDIFNESASTEPIEESENIDDILDVNINESSDEHHIKLDAVPDAKVPISTKKEISADVYNVAITNLKKTLNESGELLNMLSNVQIVDRPISESQEQYTERVVAEAMLKSIEDGPVFESVQSGDKEKVKGIVRKLRDKVTESLTKDKITFKPVHFLMKALKVNWWSTRLWQVLGVVYCSKKEKETLLNNLNSEFAGDLDGYYITTCGNVNTLQAQIYGTDATANSDGDNMNKTILDHFRTKFGWKNQTNVYFLIIDKKDIADKSTKKESSDDKK